VSCIHCPHCIARGAFGVIDPSDPALTTNRPKMTKKCQDCGCMGQEPSRRADVCTTCFRIRERVVLALHEKKMSQEDFKKYQSARRRTAMLVKLGYSNLIKENT
jgi:hypothetical protein